MPGWLTAGKRATARQERNRQAALPQNGATLRYEERLPDLSGDPGDQADFIPLLGFRQRVPLLGRGEATLRAEANLLQSNILRGLLQTRFHSLRVFQLAVFGGD